MNAGLVLPGIAAMQDEMIAIRRSIHAHPELGFEEFATSERVAACLTQWGFEVSTGVGKTGVVATLKNGEGRSIGLRADMDALPIQETSGVPYASRIDGVMHALSLIHI